MRALLFISFTLLSINFAHSFPQMIRHGYTSCTTCHASPRGGEILTDYGRALSGETLSTWSYKGEENWHYGAIKSPPSWLKIGGDFRSVQVHQENDRGSFGRYIEMQEQVQVAAKLKNNTWFSITAGSDTFKESKPWYIPGFYAQTQIKDSIIVKAGRFVPRFGVNTPEHIFSTRGSIGFGPQSERDTLEVLYFKNNWDVSLSAVIGELRNGQEAQGFYSQANYSFTSKDKLGVSFGKALKSDEAFMFGLHGLVGFTEHFYLITDSVLRNAIGRSGDKETGVFHFAKLGYEVEKGLHLFLLEDIKKTNLSEDGLTDSLYGLGITFFPRPHLELQVAYTKAKNLSRGETSTGDYAYILFHYYL